MEAKALARRLRVSPKRARLTVNLIRGKSVNEALSIIKNTNTKTARFVEKVVKSAVANAENNLELDKNNLYVKEIYVNEGPTLKRMKYGSRTNVDRHDHKTCHIMVVVAEKM